MKKALVVGLALGFVVVIFIATGFPQDNHKNLPESKVIDVYPRWSPDGKKIAFMSCKGNPSGITIINTDGSSKKVISNRTNIYNFTWSPDSKKIAYQSYTNGNWGIYVLDIDNHNEKILTNNEGNYYDDRYEPHWSPDGKKILFGTNRDGNYEIYVTDADGSNQKNLTNNPSSDINPCWSPDGEKILFVSGRDDKNEIYIMNADGSNVKKLTNDGGASPIWSPDGKKIAFCNLRDIRNGWDIYTMNVDGSNIKKLTNVKAGYISYLEWSTDGKKIAFIINGDSNIYVINTDGSNVKRLTDNRKGGTRFDWSPDGTKLTFDFEITLREEYTRTRSGKSGIITHDFVICTIDADGSNFRNLTGKDVYPVWPPNVVTQIEGGDPPKKTSTKIEPPSCDLTFEIPKDWIDWYNQFYDNIHLTKGELNAVKDAGISEWDPEYSKVINTVLPFEQCVVHVGGEGWGVNGCSFGDLQVRAYILDDPVEKIEKLIEEKGVSEAKTMIPEVKRSGWKKNASISDVAISSDNSGLWHKSVISFQVWYSDYGGTANVDFRLRHFDNKTIVFVFMYSNYKSQKDIINAILDSVTLHKQ